MRSTCGGHEFSHLVQISQSAPSLTLSKSIYSSSSSFLYFFLLLSLEAPYSSSMALSLRLHNLLSSNFKPNQQPLSSSLYASLCLPIQSSSPPLLTASPHLYFRSSHTLPIKASSSPPSSSPAIVADTQGIKVILSCLCAYI